MKQQTLSSNELAVLRVLWDEGIPLSRPELLKKIPDINWNPNSIHVVLNNLIKKGYIAVDGMVRCGQSYGRTYRATKTQGEYVASLALQAVFDAPDEDCVLDVVSAMVKHKNVSEQTITVLEQMLAKRRAELLQEKARQEDNEE